MTHVDYVDRLCEPELEIAMRFRLMFCLEKLEYTKVKTYKLIEYVFYARHVDSPRTHISNVFVLPHMRTNS